MPHFFNEDLVYYFDNFLNLTVIAALMQEFPKRKVKGLLRLKRPQIF